MSADNSSTSQDLNKFLQSSGLPVFAENLGEEFTPVSLSNMSTIELEENFMLSKESAKKIYQELEPFRKFRDQTKKLLKGKRRSIFQIFLPSNSTPVFTPTPPTFLSQFEDLSDILYIPEDDWPMDPCSAAYADESELFQNIFNTEEYNEYSNDNGWTPLMFAAVGNRQKIAEIILSNNPDLCAQNEEKQTALMIAASYGHIPIMEQFIQYAKDQAESTGKPFEQIAGLHLGDAGGFTSLHYAVDFGHHDTVAYLLQLGANPNTPDIEGMTPTLMACRDRVLEQSLPDLLKAGGILLHCNREGKNGFAIANRESVNEIFASFNSSSSSRTSQF